MTLLIADPWLPLSLIAQLVIGAGLTNFRASNNTLVQLFVSDELRGRVMSTYQLASVGMMPLGALAVGFMGRTLGPQHTVVIGRRGHHHVGHRPGHMAEIGWQLRAVDDDLKPAGPAHPATGQIKQLRFKSSSVVVSAGDCS